MAPLRFHLATAAAAGVALSSGLLAGPATAAALSGGTFELAASGYSTPACTVTGSATPVHATFTAGQTVTRSLDLAATATADTDPTDTVAMKGTQKLTVSSHVSGGQLTTFSARSKVTGSITAAKGSSTLCTDTGADNYSGEQDMSTISATVTRTTSGWVHLRASSIGYGGQFAGLQMSGGDGFMQAQIGGYAGRDISADQWAYVRPGDYTLEASLGGVSVQYAGLKKSAVEGSITVTFFPAGIAKASESGPAKPMVTFPGKLTCGTGHANAHLTSKIKGAAKVALLVNGATKKTIKHPGTATVALGVPTNQGVTLKAVVHKAGKTLTATRSYRSC